MMLAKTLLLGTYYYGTMPYRLWKERRRSTSGDAPVMVLFYHRVADQQPNDWTISTRQFARQINWLKAHFEMISLAS